MSTFLNMSNKSIHDVNICCIGTKEEKERMVHTFGFEFPKFLGQEFTVKERSGKMFRIWDCVGNSLSRESMIRRADFVLVFVDTLNINSVRELETTQQKFGGKKLVVFAYSNINPYEPTPTYLESVQIWAGKNNANVVCQYDSPDVFWSAFS